MCVWVGGGEGGWRSTLKSVAATAFKSRRDFWKGSKHEVTKDAFLCKWQMNMEVYPFWGILEISQQAHDVEMKLY